ncbi:optic atrophy 3 protein-domain-containing protein [Lentinula edodes]|uniref:optic atrophy 3 protein-domain-containing protein n=1 Tax=Lentinula edodes TaxID=5353 RepID=UPI001E8EED4E|nr:optic atrophy 3 protein-domain-containing protein [Lentinula edodes]KAH7876183.1 optic atrophy 3 protein-domain-containing protein [Lentinula edodes]
MASAKIATLLIRTIAKPISAQIKRQAKEDVAEFVVCCFVFCVSSRHERFRNFCVSLAQLMYRTEVRLRTGILGGPAKQQHIRPLSETKAIDSGANALAEGFLFSVAAALILGESYRSARNETKRRGGVDERLGVLEGRVGELERELGVLKEEGKEERKEGKEERTEGKEIGKEGKEQGKEGKDDASQKNS